MKGRLSGYLVCALVAFFAPQAVAAQDQERRGFIGLGIGPSAPFGGFADTSAINPRAGRATPGYTSTLLNLAYRFGRHLGVAAAFSYSEYDMSNGGDDDWWQVAGLTVGPMYSQRLHARAALDVKAMVGLIALTPIIDSYTTGDGTAGSLGFDIRATVRYDIFRRVAVFTEGGVQASGVSFDSGVRKDFRALISGFGVAYRPTW